MSNNNNNNINININGSGIIGNNYTPPSYVSYFFGRLLREESTKVLEKQGGKDGLFLLRELVIEAGSYALSICHQGQTHHYRIDRLEDGWVKIDKGRKFIGPVELIKHHQSELDGLVTKPLIPCTRPSGIQPVNYLFINDAEFYKLVEDEIKLSLSRLVGSVSKSSQQEALTEARGRFRYKYEKIVLKTLHFSQPWFRRNTERELASELLAKSGFENGKFLVRSNANATNNPTTDSYKISLCYNNEIKHYRIKTNVYKANATDGDEPVVKYCFDGGLEFDSITQLVDYYHRCADGLAYTLRLPFIPSTRIDPILLNILTSSNTSNTKSSTTTTTTTTSISTSSNLKRGINNMLNNEGIYDSNRMYEVIVNSKPHDTNNNNNHHHNNNGRLGVNNGHRLNNNSNGTKHSDDGARSGSGVHEKSSELGGSGGSSGGGIPYVDDEPNNPNDITNLNNIPELKRSLFENEENYEYDSLPTHTINMKDLVFYDKLGSGCFGCVHRGTYKSRHGRVVQEIPVAIKQLNIDSDESKREITKEAELMKTLNNPYIIKFIGMCFHQNGSLMIVLELAKLGPLHKYLRTHRDMSMTRIVKICYQVALAMQYLASKNLVHRDLAARNVLLVSEDLAKVSDFGMSRRMGENKYYETHSQGKWPLKWYPPDATSLGKFDEKSDVWSYGVTCWEATSYGGRPYQGIDIAMLLIKLENGHRLEKPPMCPDEMYNVMYKCWHGNKHNRPTFRELVKELRQVIYDLYHIDL